MLRPYKFLPRLLRLLGAGRRLSCGLGYAHAFFRREQCYQDVAFHARHGFNLALVANFHQQAVHLGAPDFLVRHFAPAMENHRAHFVAFAEEPDDLILANLIVVFRGSGPKLYFLQLRAAAALALLVGFFVGLIEILAVVGDLANGRIGRGRNFHQVESLFLGQLYGFKRLHDAELAAFFINHPDLASANPLVYANTVALPEVPFCDKSPSSTLLFVGTRPPRRTCFPRYIQGLAAIREPTHHHEAMNPLHTVEKRLGRASKYSTRQPLLGKRQKAAAAGLRGEP